jgi:hypothetical protein
MKKLITICLLLATAYIVKAQESFKMETYEENGKIGLLDDKGRKITVAKYDKKVYAPDSTYLGTFEATFYEGLCSAYINQKVGFIDKKGKEVIPFEYSSVHEFTVEGLAAVEKDGKWGYINKKGQLLTPISYDIASDFKNGKAVVYIDEKIYFIDVKGEMGSSSFKFIKEFNDELFIIQSNYGYFALVNESENEILPNTYSMIDTPYDGLAVVRKGQKYGYIDSKGNEVIPAIYDAAYPFDGKNAIVRIKPNYGIIDSAGKTIVPFKYYSINPFSEGLALVVLGDFITRKYGFIDEKGNEIIPAIYDRATDFENGTAKVRIGDKDFFINKKAEQIK